MHLPVRLTLSSRPVVEVGWHLNLIESVLKPLSKCAHLIIYGTGFKHLFGTTWCRLHSMNNTKKTSSKMFCNIALDNVN